eukprot:2498262-Amphidinium_carterae.1
MASRGREDKQVQELRRTVANLDQLELVVVSVLHHVHGFASQGQVHLLEPSLRARLYQGQQ